ASPPSVFLRRFAATDPASPEGAQEYRRGWSVAEPPAWTTDLYSPEGAAERSIYYYPLPFIRTCALADAP
ncbi:MAG: hypothetical protein IJ802_01095, partial [Kiritimatiellae bacterium]|nr:hypothetical protein [Kiritimatiellia bacterium]